MCSVLASVEKDGKILRTLALVHISNENVVVYIFLYFLS